MAVKWGYLPRNPADAVDKPKAPKHEINPPERAEPIRLIALAEEDGDGLAALWTLAIYSGCRQGELLGLKWSDVDFDRSTLTIRRTLARAKATVALFGEPKSDKSRRTVTLPGVAV